MTHPPIDFGKLGKIDPERLERALALLPESLGNGQFRVRRPLDPLTDPHNVDLSSEDVPRCDCGDHLWRDKVCKHIIACLIHINHPAAADALVVWMHKQRHG